MNLGALAILAGMLVVFGFVVPYVMRRNQTDEDFGTVQPDDDGSAHGDGATATRPKTRSARRKK